MPLVVFLIFFVIHTCSSRRPIPVVRTDCGLVEGAYMDDIDPELVNFRGIPYARPPVKNYRYPSL